MFFGLFAGREEASADRTPGWLSARTPPVGLNMLSARQFRKTSGGPPWHNESRSSRDRIVPGAPLAFVEMAIHKML